MRLYPGEPTVASAIGYEPLRVTGTAVAPSSTYSGVARSAVFYLDAEAGTWVRWRMDGTAPTKTSGVPIWPGQHVTVRGTTIVTNSQFILGNDVAIGPMREPPTIHAIYFDTEEAGQVNFATGPRGLGAGAIKVLESAVGPGVSLFDEEPSVSELFA